MVERPALLRMGGFSLKNVAAKCFVKLISSPSAKIYHKTLSFGGYFFSSSGKRR